MEKDVQYNLFEFCKQYSNRPHSMFNCITSQNAWSDHSNYAQYVKSASSFYAFLYENTKFVIFINTINNTMKILRQVNKIKTRVFRNKKWFASEWRKAKKTGKCQQFIEINCKFAIYTYFWISWLSNDFRLIRKMSNSMVVTRFVFHLDFMVAMFYNHQLRWRETHTHTYTQSFSDEQFCIQTFSCNRKESIDRKANG